MANGSFGEQAVNVVAEGQLQAKCHAAGAAPTPHGR